MVETKINKTKIKAKIIKSLIYLYNFKNSLIIEIIKNQEI